MVEIYKRGVSLTVPMGSFKEVFEPAGFMLRNARELTKVPDGVAYHPEEENAEEEHFSTETSADIDPTESSKISKPISEMTFSELLEYADSLGIDTEGAKNKTALKELIRSHK